MPPSPAMRCSSGREQRMENTHKRGRSFESGLPLKAKDDDLALFTDMQNRERDSFLLYSADDFDDSIAKLRYFSDYKLSINIPARGESSDLLNVDGDKNDYDWLLTPPDTPLFSSLDDDEPQPVNLAPRGRPRSQPIAISRSYMAEKTQRTSRSSASPHRLSPSPRSSNTATQSRGRPSSAPQSNPPTVQRPITPSRRPSTPPNKPCTPTPRSTTPTLRRMSTGSSGQTSTPGRRGTSHIKLSHGNSTSPKLRGWQSNLPSFSSDVPPNLRTSLSDRPASYIRGSSPASRNGRDSSSKFGRQSISPTASRSASLSHSHERDHFSSYSRGSAASSGDDDVDSLHSASVITTAGPTARKNGVIVNNRGMGFSKKPSRTPSASSAPKRSFDFALRQMDQNKTPQNMFRPLLSSVPSTTFYVGKASNVHRPMFSRNSSLTTSSNASSEQGAGVASDMEGIGHDRKDLAAEWEKPHGPETKQEIFNFDEVDEVTESGKFDGDAISMVDSQGLHQSGENFGNSLSIATASESSCMAGHNSEIDIHMMAICSRCGNCFRILDIIGTTDVCQDCAENIELIVTRESRTRLAITQDDAHQCEIAVGIDRLSKEEQLKIGAAELPDRSSISIMPGQHERNAVQGSDCLHESYAPRSMMDEPNQHLDDQQVNTWPEAISTQSDGDSKFQESHYSASPSLRIDNPEGTGISVLLQSSGSSRWPVVQGRIFSATSILCSEPSYTRDHRSAMKRSSSRDSGSASSSIDLGSSRQSEPHVQRQYSSRRSEIDNVRSDYNEKVQRSGLLYSGVLLGASEALVLAQSREEEKFDNSGEEVRIEDSIEPIPVSKEHEWPLGDAELCTTPSSSRQEKPVAGVKVFPANDCMATYTSDYQLSSHQEGDHLIDTEADFPSKDCCLSINDEKDVLNNEQNFLEKELSTNTTGSFEEDYMSNGTAGQNDISNSATDRSSAVNLEAQSDHDGSQDAHTDHTRSIDSIYIPNSNECSVSMTSEVETSGPATESGIIDCAGVVCGESMVKVEGQHMSRSLTLAEATDTVLFCSSIVHDLAYKAAAIGMEKELVPLEALCPTVTILGNSVLDQPDSRTVSHKRTPKSQRSKKKRLEVDSNTPVTESGVHLKVQESRPANPEVPSKVDSIKPPKLESKCNCIVM